MATRAVIAAHGHCCTKCRNYYYDNCPAMAENSLCTKCVSGRGWEILRVNRLPRDCCRYNSRIVDKTDRKRLSLGGPADFTWWICKDCGRTQGYDPSIKTYPS